MIESQEERIKVLGTIYYLIMEKKVHMPFFQGEISKLLQIDEKDLSLDLKYLYEQRYIDIIPGSKRFLIRGITSRGVDFIEDPFRAEGVTIISSNVNTANINADHAQMKGKGIEIIQQNTTNTFNENIAELKEKVKSLEGLIENMDSSNKDKFKKSLEEANAKLETGDRTGFIIKIKNSFGQLFEELKHKSVKEWIELILDGWSIAKLLV